MNIFSKGPRFAKDSTLGCGICLQLLIVPEPVLGMSKVDTVIAFENAHLRAHVVRWAYDALANPDDQPKVN